MWQKVKLLAPFSLLQGCARFCKPRSETGKLKINAYAVHIHLDLALVLCTWTTCVFTYLGSARYLVLFNLKPQHTVN